MSGLAAVPLSDRDADQFLSADSVTESSRFLAPFVANGEQMHRAPAPINPSINAVPKPLIIRFIRYHKMVYFVIDYAQKPQS
tara:strand:- start:817 stop:1062 length:246 start_codon:yes stop_codon:yes gene_type:complete